MKKNAVVLLGILLLVHNAGIAQRVYAVDISRPVSHTVVTPLQLGGHNPNGDSISVNNDYISVNHQPFFPIMGEFHFSRYPHQYWEESILKMKAGGINVIATYVFWILHEPQENVFDWTGDRNLGEFAALCAKHGMYLVVRVGPYGHGEIRNGAIPDWLYGRPVNIRTDDSAYLSIVKRYFGEIAAQLKGKLYKEGGTVIGIQLENEYQHAGSTWWLSYPGSDIQYTFPHSQKDLTHANTYNLDKKTEYKSSGDQHMVTLKKIAREAGLETPLYTATGWGYAAIAEKESLPVTAAYAFPSWGKLEPSPFYLFKDLRNEPDYGPARYNPWQYPCLSAEIGSGIMVTNSKRPLVPSNSIAPLMIRNIGSGSNGIGYYMFHGGATPVQGGQFMSEEAGELPKISYDFQAPIGEYGQVRQSYKELVPLHFFLNSFGSRLAPMPVTIPLNNPVRATDSDRLRYAVRSDGNSGFVFLHNYQDHAFMNDLTDLQLAITTRQGFIKIPEQGSFTLKKEQSAILPFNLLFDDILLKYATAQPLTNFEKSGIQYHVFASIDGIAPEFSFQTKNQWSVDKNGIIKKSRNGGQVVTGTDSIFSFSTRSGKITHHFLVIPMSMALNARSTKNGLAFTSQTLVGDAGGIDIITRNIGDTILFFPALASAPEITGATINPINPAYDGFSVYQINFTPLKPMVKIAQPWKTNAVIQLTEQLQEELNDVFLKIDYVGDKAQAMLGGQLVADHFYYGEPWEIGLKRFANQLKGQPIYLLFHPLKKDAPCLEYLAGKVPAFGAATEYLQINSISLIPEYKCRLMGL